MQTRLAQRSNTASFYPLLSLPAYEFVDQYLTLFLFLTGNMYAVGGCDESNFRLNSVERYNPSTNTWTFTAPMTTCRSSPCVLTCRALYVIGGVSYVGMSLNTGEYLDPVTNTWRPIAPMRDKRASASGAATNGKIYVIGESFHSFVIIMTCSIPSPLVVVHVGYILKHIESL